MRAFVDRLHAEGRRFVPILDPGIALAPGYAPYDSGLAAGVFLRDLTGAPYIGEVWPGAVHFIDFLHPGVEAYWAEHVGRFYEEVPFDGLWVVSFFVERERERAAAAAAAARVRALLLSPLTPLSLFRSFHLIVRT